MKKQIILIFLSLIFFFPLNAAVKDQIISKLEKTKNISFSFHQKINQKTEEGDCIIEYPKKIFCSYNNLNKKIMVSNGKTLVIKNNNINQYYVYSLKRTPFNLFLDKNYLINEIRKLEGRKIEDKYINFTLLSKDYEINIFFDSQTLDLIGWQTEDIYQNLVITFIYKVKINQKIKKNTFKLPERN